MSKKMLNSYIARNHTASVFTANELSVIQKGDIGKMVTTFLDLADDDYNQQLQSVLVSLNQLLNVELELEDIAYDKEYSGKFIGCQMMTGDMDAFLAIAGDNTTLLKLAADYCREELPEFDELAYDALCELINCIDGLYATRLSEDDYLITISPPVFYTDKKISCRKGMYRLTFKLQGEYFDLLIVSNDRVNMC